MPLPIHCIGSTFSLTMAPIHNPGQKRVRRQQIVQRQCRMHSLLLNMSYMQMIDYRECGTQNFVQVREDIFFWPASKNCYNHDGTPKRQPSCVDCIACWSPGGRTGPFWAQNWTKNLIFQAPPIETHLFGLSRTRLNAIITRTP